MKAPRSPWHPDLARFREAIGDAIPPDRRPLVMKSVQEARMSRCLQPPGNQAAVRRIGALWSEMSGSRREGPNILKYAAGGGAGLLGGLGMAYGASLSYPGMGEAAMMAGGVAGAALGAAAGHFVGGGTAGFEQAMLLLIINERRSVVRKAMVTDQVEFWVPKAMMLHRQHEWRRDRRGRTYMFLQLPYRARITAVVRNMVDALDLPDDPHYTLDAAVKGQRVWDRKLAQNAQEWGHLDDGEPERKPFEEMMPHIIGGGMMVLGVVLIMVVTGR